MERGRIRSGKRQRIARSHNDVEDPYYRSRLENTVLPILRDLLQQGLWSLPRPTTVMFMVQTQYHRRQMVQRKLQRRSRILCDPGGIQNPRESECETVHGMFYITFPEKITL